MTLIRITHRTIIENNEKYPVKRIEIYPGGLIFYYRNKNAALKAYSTIFTAAKGGQASHYQCSTDRISFRLHATELFKPAEPRLTFSYGNINLALTYLHNTVSRKAYNSLLTVIWYNSHGNPARYSYDSSEDFEQLNGNVITHYFKKNYS